MEISPASNAPRRQGVSQSSQNTMKDRDMIATGELANQSALGILRTTSRGAPGMKKHSISAHESGHSTPAVQHCAKRLFRRLSQ